MIDFGFGLNLLPLTWNNREIYRKWRNSYAIRSMCRQVGLIGELEQEDWFDRQAKDPSMKMFEINKSFTPLGVCGLTSIDLINRRAEFSLYIGGEHQRKGYSKPALMTLLSFGFYELGLNRIWGETFESNYALKIFRSIGMEDEGRRREFYYKNGRFIDCYLVSIGRHDFMATNTGYGKPIQ